MYSLKYNYVQFEAELSEDEDADEDEDGTRDKGLDSGTTVILLYYMLGRLIH